MDRLKEYDISNPTGYINLAEGCIFRERHDPLHDLTSALYYAHNIKQSSLDAMTRYTIDNLHCPGPEINLLTNQRLCPVEGGITLYGEFNSNEEVIASARYEVVDDKKEIVVNVPEKHWSDTQRHITPLENLGVTFRQEELGHMVTKGVVEKAESCISGNCSVPEDKINSVLNESGDTEVQVEINVHCSGEDYIASRGYTCMALGTIVCKSANNQANVAQEVFLGDSRKNAKPVQLSKEVLDIALQARDKTR